MLSGVDACLRTSVNLVLVIDRFTTYKLRDLLVSGLMQFKSGSNAVPIESKLCIEPVLMSDNVGICDIVYSDII